MVNRAIMAAMPGCPERDIIAVSPANGGAIVKLACTHELYVAGAPNSLISHNGRLKCQSGPCYRFQKGMGDEC